jgi:uncharacterized repeat protein (TIGR03803 family)
MYVGKSHRISLLQVWTELGLTKVVQLIALTAALGCLWASAQTLTTLHNFSGTGDGMSPSAGLTMDRGGNFYGTTVHGGAGFGTVFKLSHAGSGWVLNTLYTFQGTADGANPQARVVFGPDGALYGTTTSGGQNLNGTVFRLTPPLSVCKAVSCPWTLTTLYRFTGGLDGGNPEFGDLVFDAAGNIFGTTNNGGHTGCSFGPCGVVYKLTRAGNSWTHSLVYSFSGALDGSNPFSGVVIGSDGSLYGTAAFGGPSFGGTVYKLTNTGSGWTLTTLHAFGASGDGDAAIGGVVLGTDGAFYGATWSGGPGGGGVVYRLQFDGSNWNYRRLHNFFGSNGTQNDLGVDAQGNVYGTTFLMGTHSFGQVFKVGPPGVWTYTTVHDFTGGHDGGFPITNIIADPAGNIYGTATVGGTQGSGVAYVISPN